MANPQPKKRNRRRQQVVTLLKSAGQCGMTRAELALSLDCPRVNVSATCRYLIERGFAAEPTKRISAFGRRESVIVLIAEPAAKPVAKLAEMRSGSIRQLPPTIERIHEVFEAVAGGMSIREASRAFNLSKSSIQRYIAKSNRA